MSTTKKFKECLKSLCIKTGEQQLDSKSTIFFHEVPVPKELLHKTDSNLKK